MPTEEINERTLFLSFWRICLRKEKNSRTCLVGSITKWVHLPEAIRNWVVNECEVADGLKIMHLSDIQVLFRAANEEQAVKTLLGGRNG